MMSLVLGFLTFILVFNCLFLMLLILIQLPKKEAGAGVAFGGGATDALFGAGSGNALTKMTKYAATLFVGLALALSVLNAFRAKEGNRRLDEELRRKASASAQMPAVAGTNNPLSVPATQALPGVTLPEATNALRTTVANSASTNATVAPTVQSATNTTVAPAVPAPASTNPPAAPPQ